MSILSLTQAERAELAYIKPIYLVDWTLESTVLHLADRDWRYVYGSSEILYESYLLGVQGIGEIVSKDGNITNSNVTIEIANQRWSTYEYLSKLNAAIAFSRSSVTIWEVRRFTGNETFATDIRDCKGKYIVEQLLSYDRRSLKLGCSSRAYNKRNAWGLSKIDRAAHPYCAPEDVGQYRNIAYGAIENIPCRCVKTGAIDLLSADITATQTTITTQGLRRFAFESSGTIQVGTELIPYTSWSAATETFSGCVRTNGSAHSADDPVMQVLTRFVYEAGKHPYRSISKVSVDDYDNTDTDEITAYTGGSGDELAGYEGRSVVEVIIPSQAIVKVINKDIDKHTHTMNSSICRMPNSVTASPVGASGGTNAYDRDRTTYAYLIDNASPSYFDFAFAATSGSEPIVTKVKIWFLLEAYSATYGDQLRGNVTITHNGLTIGTITHGTSLPKQWLSYEVNATADFVDYDTGYRISKDTTGETGTQIRIYETYVEKYTNGTKVMPTGGTYWSTVANIYDGNTSTYAVSTTGSSTLTFAADTNANVPKRITVRMLFETTTVYAPGTIYIRRDGLLLYSVSTASLISKQWFEWVDDDPYDRAATISVAVPTLSGFRIYECYIIVEESSTGIDPYEATKQVTADSIRGGLHTAQLVVGDEVTVDAETRYDDGSGTITGTPGSLITRPDHVLKHFLTVLMGQSSGDIGSSFAASGALFSTEGYTLAFLAHDVSPDGHRLLAILANQCRSMFYEWGGKFELKYLPDSTPSADFALEDDDLIFSEFPKYSEKPVWEVANDITCYFDRDYRTKKRVDSEMYRLLDPEAASHGYKSAPLKASYGTADIQQDLTLNAVTDQTMAQDVLDYVLAKKQLPQTLVELAVKWRAIQTSPGQYFSFTDSLIGAACVYRILEFKLSLERGRIDIKGEKV